MKHKCDDARGTVILVACDPDLYDFIVKENKKWMGTQKERAPWSTVLPAYEDMAKV